jgi:hypothetical protein
MNKTEKLWWRSLPLADKIGLRIENLTKAGAELLTKLCRKKTYISLGSTLPRKWREGR